MNGSTAIKDRLLALQGLGVGEMAHLNGKLETHLLGTYRLLIDWGNPAHVCDAGLFHAVYGTQPLKRLGIPHKEFSPSDRPGIREIIGEESERLVYLYGACDRDFFYPQIGSPNAVYRDRFTGNRQVLTSETLREILEITLANELEICLSRPAIPDSDRKNYRHLFDRFQGLVSAPAYHRYAEVFGIPH